ncbi:uncharacterized protein BDFB_003721, partial [Asbolus verrucosus]
IQSWWEVPSIAHFCSLFRTAFNLLDFDIEDLEEALLTDGTEETSWLQELIVRLLSGCLPNNEISTFNYQMFLRRLFRQKCQEHDQYNPFNTDIDFQLLPLRTKVDILHALCDFRLDADDVLDQLKNLEADSLRVEPLGYDSNDSAYWYFYGTRLYREDFKTKNNKKKSVWQVICFTEDDWFQLNKKFKKSTSKCERQLYRTLTENFLPELPRLFREKERLARKRLLENQPRRTSRRLRKVENVEKEEASCDLPKQFSVEEEEKQRKRDLEIKRREAYERRNRLKEQSEDSQSEKSEVRYEMGGAKARQKKSKGRQRKLSTSSSNSKDAVPASKSSKRKKPNEDISKSPSSSATTTVGRQTNNSLAAATGQIVIQPVANPHKKKLKTSQVFRQTDEDLITGMHKILDYVKNHEDAWPFADPVDEDYAPNYYTVIRKPMDLQRMEERLDSGYYKSFTKFRDDFQLIVDNCRLYNGAENEYTEMVGNLLKVFKIATEKFLDQISSSDDEIAVEFPNSDSDVKESKKIKSDLQSKSSKRKPTLAAKTDKKREHSLSEESLGKRSLSYDSLIDTNEDETFLSGRKDKTSKKTNKISKKNKNETKKSVRDKKNLRTNNKHKEKYSSPIRSRSPSRSVSRNSFVRSYSSSPPPSSAPSSPDNRFDFFPKKHNLKSFVTKDVENHSAAKGKQKQKQDKFKELFEQDDTNSGDTELKKQNEKSAILPSKPKDKHNKLRETIEKLKAKSEISNKLNDDEFRFDLDTPKENKEKSRKDKEDKSKNKKDKLNKSHSKKDLDFEDSNSTIESLLSDNKKRKKTNSKSAGIKNASIEALTIATEQTLKDINKWLDDTPKFSEFSSASNSPSYTALDDFDIVNKIDNDPRKKIDKFSSKKDGIGKDIKRRTFSRDPSKFLKRREVQRTIDRLQPGKSKGNLISSVQNSKQTDELFPLGPLSKNKDTKNSLIVKTDDNAPKLSLGSVLDSFGRHKFVDDNAKPEESDDVKVKDKDKFTFQASIISNEVKEDKEVKVKLESEKKESPVREESSMMSGATPNLSAWFKAFGAPKIQSAQKKTDSKSEGKENEKSEENFSKSSTEQKPKEEVSNKIPIPDLSPNTDSPVTPHGQPIPRQRKVSTGSSISERSSFSQDMDSPRVGIDERLGAYPAPYPSPLHRSPSGASPVMASPRPDVSPKAAPYPPFNGQIRVGFYQDTVSNKSSPDKSCSPRDNPQSPYAQCSEHVYTPNTTQNIAYSYPNSPYYSHTPNYSNTNPTPPYNPETINPASYYDTNKSLTDQYQAKTTQNFVGSPVNNVPSPASHPQHSPNVETFRQEDQNQNKVSDKLIQSAMFPVKKRAYNEADAAQLNAHRYETELNRNLQQLDGQPVQTVNSPMHMQNSRAEEPMKHYIHQNIPDPKPLTVQTDSYNKTQSSVSPVQQVGTQQLSSPIINYSAPSNPYNNNYGNESNYPLNIPTARSLASTQNMDRKIDITKYTNMGYTGSEVNFSRGVQQYNRPELTYVRPPSSDQQPVCSNQPIQQTSDVPLLYTNSNPHMGYKNIEMNAVTSNPQQAHTNYTNSSAHSSTNRLAQPLDVQSSYKSNEVSIPRPTYNTHLEMDQPLGLRGNIANLSHIVDRYNNDERMLSSLQPPASQYYGDKGLGAPHMFNKPISTSSSGLPIFNQSNMGMQSYNQNMQATTSSMYNRQMTELQSPNMTNEAKNARDAQQVMEKKPKKRKSSKS